MAATTISRASLTDGVTVWNVSTIGSAIYDKVDALVAGNVTFGGTLGAEGFGAHAFVAGGTGVNYIRVANTTAGTGNYAEVRLSNDNNTTLCRLVGMSSTFTTSGMYVASSVSLVSSGAGGLGLAADNATGTVRLYSAGMNMRLEVDANGTTNLYRGLALAGSYDQTVTGTQQADDAGAYYSVIRLTSCTSTPKLSKLSAGTDGDIKILINLSGAACTLQHNDGTATKKMYLSNAADGTLSDNESIMFIYDAGETAWIQVGPQ